MKKTVIIVLIFIITCFAFTGCGGGNSYLEKIKTGIEKFDKIDQAELKEVYDEIETTKILSTGQLHEVKHNSICTVNYSIGEKGCEYLENTYLYYADGTYEFYGEKQQDGLCFTTDNQDCQKQDIIWTSKDERTDHWGEHSLIQYMKYMPDEQFIDPEVKIEQEGKLTKYTINMTKTYMDAVGNMYGSSAVYTPECRDIIYWIDEDGVLVKHVSVTKDMVSWGDKERCREILKVVELKR